MHSHCTVPLHISNWRGPIPHPALMLACREVHLHANALCGAGNGAAGAARGTLQHNPVRTVSGQGNLDTSGNMHS